MSIVSSRKATLQERFCIARRNSGYPPVMTLAASYPSVSAAPTDAFLQKRIIELQEHFPFLSTRMEGRRAPEPIQVLREKPWAPKDILAEATYQANADSAAELEDVIVQENEQEGVHVAEEDMDAHPLWHVRRVTSPSKATTYIALSVDHVITDGRGMVNLFDALLSPDISSLPYEKLETITRFEDTVPIKPSLAHTLPFIFLRMVLPLFPVFLQRYFTPYPFWPHTAVRAAPTSCPPLSSLVSLPAPLISALKTTGKGNGVATLHPVLKTAYSLAIYSIYRHTLPPPFIVNTSSPRSERNTSLGHAYCTANYISSQNVYIQFDSMEDFWSHAGKVAKELLDPRGIAMEGWAWACLRTSLMGSCTHLTPRTLCTARQVEGKTGLDELLAK
ncbi:hypothetical protein IAT38_007150 [Cryptococcus sp. DSM 104549]